MDDRIFAKHLKQPEGEIGAAVGNIMNEMNQFMNYFTYDFMGIKKGDQLLEIGFGNGNFIHDLFSKHENIRYKGIELSKKMVTEASVRNQLLILEKKVELIIADGENIPYNDEVFDKVCLINTLYFLKNPIQNFKEINRVLKKKGKVYISIRSKQVMEKQAFTKFYFRLYSIEEVTELLNLSGFHNISYKTIIEPTNNNLDVVCITGTK